MTAMPGPVEMPGPVDGGNSAPVLLRRYPPYASIAVSPPWAVVAWFGDIDVATAGACRRAADEAIRSGATHVAIDLRAVTFLDSSGLAVVSRLLRACREREGEVCLLEPQPIVATALRVTGFAAAAAVVDLDALWPAAATLIEPAVRLTAEGKPSVSRG